MGILSSRFKPDPGLVARVNQFEPPSKSTGREFSELEKEFKLDRKKVVNLRRINGIDIRNVFNQLKIARLLEINYRNVDITIEGLDNVPNEPFILAMNHTDRYSYWPIQFELFKQRGLVSSVWVKGGKRSRFTNWF